MASVTWNGTSGDWTNAADWAGGVVPGASSSVTFGGAGAYTATLYTVASAASVTMNAPGALFYDSGALALGGVFQLEAGTFALAYGALQGGTLALQGGVFAAEGGTLNGVAVQGDLTMAQANASLFVQNGLAMAGANGAGAGTLAVTGSYAMLDFVGSQILANAIATLGATGPGPGQGGAASLAVSHGIGATAGATLTLSRNVWVQETGTQGQIIVGAGLPGAVTDEVVNQGTITDAAYGSTLTLGGPGLFDNAGTIGISNGATLDIASGGFTNTGTILVAGATLDLGGTFATSLLSSLGALTLTAATLEIGGDAINTGATLNLGASSALGPILLAGTITGGTIVDSGGGLNLSAGTGLLDGVAYQGSLALGANAILTLADSTTIGSAAITGAGSALLLEGLSSATTTLNNATISLGGGTGAAELGTTDIWLASNATTAILGPHLTVQQTGQFAAIDANATTPIEGYGLSDTLVNQGSITGAIAGGTLTLGGAGTFINQGKVAVSNADTLVIDALRFSNTGTILVSGGATAILGGPPDAFGQSPAWSNTGVIDLVGGTLVLSGTVQTPQIGRVVATGGAISLAGTLNNAGDTLTLGAGGLLPALSLAGTIIGGTITDPGGLLTTGTQGAALLDGVTDTGTLNLSAAGSWLRIRDGLTLNGAAYVTGAGAELGFQGSQTFDHAQIMLGATGRAATLDVLHDSGAPGPSTLTLGPALTITQSGALADIGSAADVPGDAIVLDGAINAAVALGTLALGGGAVTNHGRINVSGGDTLALTATSFSNTGTITVSNAALAIRDDVSISALGSLVLSNAAVSIAGTLTDTGTLAIGAGAAWGRIALTGEISGGTITDTGGGLNATGGATLNDVAYQGLLDLSRPFQQLAVTGGIALTGAGGSGAAPSC